MHERTPYQPQCLAAMSNPVKSQADHTVSTTEPRPDRALHATLRIIALLIGIAGSLMGPYLYLFSVRQVDGLAPTLIAGLAWIALLLLRRGYSRYVPHLIVFGTLMAAVIGVLSFGSMRSAATVIFVAGVAAAGVFLERSALIASVIFSFCAMLLLLWAEQQGLMHEPVMRVNVNTTLVYMITTLVVAIMVYYSRQALDRANKRLQAELESRQRMEQERDLSMERFARMFRTNPAPMIAQSPRSGLILDVNPAFERQYGYSRDELIGKEDTRLWGHLDQRDDYVQRLSDQRHVHNFQTTALRSDGSTFDALLSSELGNDPHDKLLITTIADISTQALAMEKLMRSEERFAKAFNFSPLKMSITRVSDGKLMEVNQTKDAIQGSHKEDLMGKTTMEIGGWLSNEERQIFLDRLLREGFLDAYETRMLHIDGSVIDAKMWAVTMELDGEYCSMSCIVNVTEEKRREAQLLNLAKAMAGQTGQAFFTSLVNDLAETLGADMLIVAELQNNNTEVRTLAGTLDGEALDALVYPLEGSPCQQATAQQSLRVIPDRVAELFPNDPYLSEGQFKAYAGQSLLNENGQAVGILAALWRHPIGENSETAALMAIYGSRAAAELLRLQRDLEITRLNDTLEQRVSVRTAELEKLNSELDSFAYSISHDLKSPLRAIDGFTQLLSEQLGGHATERERELMDRVLGATHRMSNLMADLLDLARVSQDAMVPEKVDLSQMAKEISLQITSRVSRPALQWKIQPGLTAFCDARLIRMALANLFDNAAKFTRDQPAALIEFGLDTESSARVPMFFVRDNGVGFSMEHANKLFKPFQRLHMPSTGFEGTGIGLATVRRIIERHGGSIDGVAAPGEGAQFNFTLEPLDPHKNSNNAAS
jgi:PAS domain S-box-containing protein